MQHAPKRHDPSPPHLACGPRAALRTALIASLVLPALLPVLLPVLLPSLASAEPPVPDRPPLEPILEPTLEPTLERTLEDVRVLHRLPALGTVVVDADQQPRIVVSGVRRRGDETPVAEGDLWHLGSNTKAMTATMIAVLVDRGTLDWDLSPATVFADLAKDAGVSIHPDWSAVTLRHLLSNRSGVSDEMIDDALWGRLFFGRTIPPGQQRRELTLHLLAKPPAHPPGKVFEYSNAGFAIAGAMAEVRTGGNYEELMGSHLFKPLQMQSAGFGAPGSADQLDQPRGHSERGGAIEPGPFADNPPALAPAGTVHMSLADWARFAAFHASKPDEQSLLKPQTFRLLHEATPGDPKTEYAMGWVLRSRAWGDPRDDQRTPKLMLFHNGSNTRWMAVMWVVPETRQAFLAVTNQGGDAAEDALEHAIKALLNATPPGTP